ncbi:hypothetical protein GCM10011514_06350 [Emticicia aquatilis]|uniref:Uncharacterized protein n=1 Tax=Emticicia aquatilis TaxID=1537369 RepID=A0A916YHN0_9BACT|nr:hypothetical protein [Emticicia aquatilis]GGD45053.1 hypothetical protein GCM10011514_06350 [Emticicia aquatilis]
MYAKPDSIPSATEFLKSEDIETDVLESALLNFLFYCPIPDHFEDPYDYILAMSYYEVISSFLEILQNERKKSPKSTFRTA